MLKKNGQIDPEVMTQISAHFSRDEECLHQMLKEELNELENEIKGGLTLIDELKQAKYLSKLTQRIDMFMKQTHTDSLRYRNRIKVKITNAKRFILSHLKNL